MTVKKKKKKAVSFYAKPTKKTYFRSNLFKSYICCENTHTPSAADAVIQTRQTQEKHPKTFLTTSAAEFDDGELAIGPAP